MSQTLCCSALMICICIFTFLSMVAYFRTGPIGIQTFHSFYVPYVEKDYDNHTYKSFTNIPGKIDSLKNTTKIVLLWNDFFGNVNWSMGFGREPFSRCPGHAIDCLITNNRTFTYKSDAILFHANELHIRDKPAVKPPHQRWVYFNQESPLFQFWDTSGFRKWNGLFNWTMTYRSDSDIWIKYGSAERLISAKTGSAERLISAKTKLNLSYHLKENGVAWMVSNCIAPSRRWQLYQKLSKHIPIDIYGNCGPKKCPRSDQCMAKLAQKYKFYLSFENALCRDYITEKAFEPLKYGIVPIVYGGGNYTTYLPQGSYINVLEYNNITRLADLIKSFKNDTVSENRYNTYFTWRNDFEIVDAKAAYHLSFCDLCRKLHDKNAPNKVYEDIGSWWNRTGTCISPSKIMAQWI